MNYYLNEYSLRNQFRNTDDFFESLRKHTFPAIEKIQENGDCIIFKKETLWAAKICNDISLNNIPRIKNKRCAELPYLIIQLQKFMAAPYWIEDENDSVEVLEYKFDETYRDNFDRTNCFTKALLDEGTIISFAHDSYKTPKLFLLVILFDGKANECELHNIYDKSCFECLPKIRKWPHTKYNIEVRANEPAYHPPHFHVSHDDYSAMISLKTGELFPPNRKLPPSMVKDIRDIYAEKEAELNDAWDKLHNKIQRISPK